MKTLFRLDYSVHYDQRSDSYVSFCPSLGVYSAGITRREARAALRSAVVMYLDASAKTNAEKHLQRLAKLEGEGSREGKS